MTKRIAGAVLASFLIAGIFAPAANAASPVVARKTVVVLEKERGVVLEKERGFVDRKTGVTEKERSFTDEKER